MADRILDSVLDAALREFYGTPDREFTDASRARMKAAILTARGTDGGRTLTIDLDTGAWTSEGGAILQAGDGYRVAASVLPGWPEERIAEEYGRYMSADPAPRRMEPAIRRSVERLRGGIEL
ncbi:hypothetical protein QDA02_gp24 [Microbacterium phage Margaery]|uniref:Uncharacterized protein n=1 Tax=Microbacterium phage Margaery TaxID=2591217 RepID=A0A514DHP2_9CAUD|nr:hypothetical protein QDA02_gp24 [Microbacterium phage Margaery]QDH93141.1 hypothetical protein PBI_MARGAERY_84 [Microbacterium phage Margaery]